VGCNHRCGSRDCVVNETRDAIRLPVTLQKLETAASCRGLRFIYVRLAIGEYKMCDLREYYLTDKHVRWVSNKCLPPKKCFQRLFSTEEAYYQYVKVTHGEHARRYG
jgi:hypothetical protein